MKNKIKSLNKTGVFHIIFSRYASQLLGIIQRILLARILGASNIGHIAVVKSVLALVNLPASLGSYTSITKLIAETDDDNEKSQILKSGVYYNLITSFISIIITFFVLFFFNIISNTIATKIIYLLLLLIPIQVITQLGTSFLAGSSKMKLIGKIETLISFLRFILVIGFGYFLDLNGWIIAQAIICFTLFIIYFHNLVPYTSGEFDFKIVKKIFKIGSWAFLGQALGTIMLQFDTLCISGIMKDASQTGIYNTAAQASQQMIAVSGGILYTIFPIIAKNKKNIKFLKAKYLSLTKKITILNLFIIVIALLSAPVFFSLFGKDFSGAVSPFRILAFVTIVRSLHILTNTYLDALGRTDLTFTSGIFATVLNIVLNLLLIPKYGINGAAWATLISMALSYFIRIYFLSHFIFKKEQIR